MTSPSENRPLKRRKSKNVKLSKNGNPTSRPFLSRIFGMATTLVITLGLVGIVVFLRKTLPNGTKPSYANSSTLQAQKRGAEPEKIGERQANFFTLGPAFTAKPPILPGDFPIISSTVSCTTVMVPARHVKRQGYWHTYCSTSYFKITRTPTPTPTPTRGPLFTLRPTRIFTFRLPSGSPVVDCTTYFIPDKIKRGEEIAAGDNLHDSNIDHNTTDNNHLNDKATKNDLINSNDNGNTSNKSDIHIDNDTDRLNNHSAHDNHNNSDDDDDNR
ncbi:hypothetical protein QBC36DRAFT_305101 [Triangularia setosa]|uniref:Uncharacterized protein n=1 Tax=Triangularia setosa TaxID=2587417 RepID=A0AAN6VZY3_9PEZI|nr:hypothetical protein QBC36DRAFT_305101 [Podospora setosa]